MPLFLPSPDRFFEQLDRYHPAELLVILAVQLFLTDTGRKLTFLAKLWHFISKKCYI